MKKPDLDYFKEVVPTNTTDSVSEGTQPNRFDPFEALDEIRRLSTLAGVRRNVERLRAYITGMER